MTLVVLAGVLGVTVARSHTVTPLIVKSAAATPALNGWWVGAPDAIPAGVKQQIVEDYAGGTNWTTYSPHTLQAGQRLMLAVGALTSAQATTIAQNLVNAGQGNALIRPMWEMNQGTWNSPWNQSSFSASQYIAQWTTIWTAMTAVSGQSFKFIWNPNGDDGNNLAGRTTTDTYPGDSMVDYIGVDTYDHYGGSINGNITAMDAFAAAHSKPFVVPEWGMNNTDDTTFMSAMISFIQNPANNVFLQCYFSGGPNQGAAFNAVLSSFPNSKALYASAFAAPAPIPPHVMLVMMENKNYSEVIGQSSQPYTNSLATTYGLATDSFASFHPSLPNYLNIASGSNQGVTVDEPPSSSGIFNKTTLATQLAAAGFSAKAYAENLPSDPTNDSGEYAVRHNPWEYFSAANTMPVADASTMVTDLNSATPPDFVWYTPNLIDDEHDGTVQQGDSFLSSFIPSVQATSWYKAGGVVVIEWDESDTDNTNGGGHIPTIVVSASLSGQQSTSQVDTAGVLHSIEDSYGLAHLGGGSSDGNIDSLLGASSTPPTTTTTVPSTTTTTGVGTTTTTTSPSCPSYSSLPPAPTNVKATVSGTSVAVTWSDPCNALGNDVYLDGTLIAYPGWPTAGYPFTSYTATNVANGAHSIQVSTWNSGGNSVKSTPPVAIQVGPVTTTTTTAPTTTTTTTHPTTTTTQPTTTTTTLPAPFHTTCGTVPCIYTYNANGTVTITWQ